MNDERVSKTNIENDFVAIFEKYPKSIEKAIFICFELILECFIVILGQKKTIQVLEQAKKSIRGGKYTQKSEKPRKTRKKTSKAPKKVQKSAKLN
jgi:hypothetical protein